MIIEATIEQKWKKNWWQTIEDNSIERYVVEEEEESAKMTERKESRNEEKKVIESSNKGHVYQCNT